MSGTQTKQTAYKDDFSMQHSSMTEVLEFALETEAEDRWVTVPTNSIEFFDLPEDMSKLDDVIETFFMSEDDKDIVADTMQNTGLLAAVGDKFYCIRKCAVKSILERAKIKGTALGRLSRKSLSGVLDECMRVGRGDALVYLSHGKISAVHGGDECDYSVLRISGLLEGVEAELEARFPDSQFLSGYTDHCFTTALWTLPEQKEELLGAYEKEMQRHGISGHTLLPGIRFTTSNVAMSGANIYPYIMDMKHKTCIRLGAAIKVQHDKKRTVDNFNDEIKLLLPKFVDTAKALNKLLSVDLFYPLDAMAKMMDKIGIPKKVACSVLETYKLRHGDGPSTAHEAFWGISEAVFFMRADGASEAKVIEAEEKLARALHHDWREFDYSEVMAA